MRTAGDRFRLTLTPCRFKGASRSHALTLLKGPGRKSRSALKSIQVLAYGPAELGCGLQITRALAVASARRGSTTQSNVQDENAEPLARRAAAARETGDPVKPREPGSRSLLLQRRASAAGLVPLSLPGTSSRGGPGPLTAPSGFATGAPTTDTISKWRRGSVTSGSCPASPRTVGTRGRSASTISHASGSGSLSLPTSPRSFNSRVRKQLAIALQYGQTGVAEQPHTCMDSDSDEDVAVAGSKTASPTRLRNHRQTQAIERLLNMQRAKRAGSTVKTPKAPLLSPKTLKERRIEKARRALL